MNVPRQICAAALSAAALFVAVPKVTAQEAEGEAEGESPFTLRGLLAPTFGQSIVSEEPSLTGLRYELAGGAAVDEFRGELAFGFTHFLSDRPNDAQQVIVSDMLAGASYDLAQVDVVTFRPRVDVVLPTSKHSQQRTLWFASHLGFDAIVSVGPMYLLGRARLRRDVHRDDVPEMSGDPDDRNFDPGPVGFRNAGSRLEGREDLGPPSFAPPPRVVVLALPNVAWGTHLGLDVEGLIPGGLFVNLGFGWTHTWSYALPRERNIIIGEGQPERLQLNTHTGKVGVGWRSDTKIRFEARLGLTTIGRSRYADDSGPRFPFFNLEDPAYNDSVLDLQLSARYR